MQGLTLTSACLSNLPRSDVSVCLLPLEDWFYPHPFASHSVGFTDCDTCWLFYVYDILWHSLLCDPWWHSSIRWQAPTENLLWLPVWCSLALYGAASIESQWHQLHKALVRGKKMQITKKRDSKKIDIKHFSRLTWHICTNTNIVRITSHSAFLRMAQHSVFTRLSCGASPGVISSMWWDSAVWSNLLFFLSKMSHLCFIFQNTCWSLILPCLFYTLILFFPTISF